MAQNQSQGFVSPYRNALVTGVSSGLGYGMARALLANKTSVYGMSRRDPAQTEAKDLLHWDNFYFQSVDLQALETIQSKMQDLLANMDHLDLVVLNAGILGRIQDMAHTSIDELNQLMVVNTYANKVVIDFLLHRKISCRQIVAISSGASVSGNRGWNGYSLSKASLNMLIQLYANEMPESHIVSLAPGLIDTAMQDFIYSLDEDERYPKILSLKQKKGTSDMPGSIEAGQNIVNILPDLLSLPSGSFQDVRAL